MTHTIHDRHLGWQAGQVPARTVAPGDELTLELADASGNRVQRGDTAAVVPTLKPENANPLTGPVAIDGAEPGDLLVVDILDYAHADWGWTAIIPGFGLLSEDFPEPYLHVSDYDGERVAFGGDEIVLPTRPFAGTIGVCPVTSGSVGAIPPHHCGGNMDFQDLRAGSRLFFPVEQRGALFSAGDGHACQGDGEVCGTAVETRLSVRVHFELLKGRKAPAPKALVTGDQRNEAGSSRLVTMGVAEDLMTASRDAVRFMIDELTGDYGLEPELAYCLCSCAANLRIAEVVNAPNWTVVCELPLSIFR